MLYARKRLDVLCNFCANLVVSRVCSGQGRAGRDVVWVRVCALCAGIARTGCAGEDGVRNRPGHGAGRAAKSPGQNT